MAKAKENANTMDVAETAPVEDVSASVAPPVFSKGQILSSKRFRSHCDMLGFLLSKDKLYTEADIEKIVDKYMKGTVK